jgi:HAD superfamily hydrolase (TIGR01549 family)
MKIRFPVLLLDFEGTLVNFQWKLKDAAREIKDELRRLGFEPADWEDNYATLRNNVQKTFRVSQTLKVSVMDRLDAIYDRYDQDAASRWSVLPGIRSVLPRLKSEQHIKLGLVSNIGRRAIDDALPRLGLIGLFDIIITRNDVAMLKPSGEGIKIALEKLGAANSDALFIGDSVTDILAATDAGIKVAIVQGGESAPASLIAAGPSYLWNAIEEIEILYSGGEPID